MNTLKTINPTEKIKTTKQNFPQIYAYTLPTVAEKNGWIKIGYTERQSVEERIKEQTHTAAFRLVHKTLWAEPAQFAQSAIYFKDHAFHHYLTNLKERKREPNSEWFFYNGTPNLAHQDFQDFIGNPYDQAKEQLAYTLRAEQQQAVEKTLNYAKNNEEGEFLWNAKPRFGKTLTTYDFALKLGARNVLIVTNRPAIANSWLDDFEKFIAWQSDFAFVSESDSLKHRNPLSREAFLEQYGKENGKKNMLAFLSLQDLKGSIHFGGNFDKLKWVENTRWDLLVIDEAHEGVDTLKTDVAFDKIQRKFTLHLSGTPFKAIASGKFSEEEIYNWSYADEQKAKTLWQGESNNPYETLPTLNMFSYQMSQMITDKVNQGAEIGEENHDFAFDLNEFFATKENGKFIHEKEVIKWLDTLTGNEKYPFSTPELRQELKHTFWLLDRVASAKALEKLLKNSFGFSEYEIVLAAGDGRNDDDEQQNSRSSLEKVRKAIKSGKKTITLSVGQLTTGITIPEWTAVLMLSNLKSPALYMQAAFRAQNPWEYSENGKHYRKENAYLFDFAPERTLMIYDEFANNLGKMRQGGGTSQERAENIKELLNFFPVIAEDSEGKMVELDAASVLTIPKAIKAAEVVRRGFMSNLLFDNIGGIFSGANEEVQEILSQLPIAKDDNKINTPEALDTQNVQVDEAGNAVVNPQIIINETAARFGEKIYKTLEQNTAQLVQTATPNLAENIAKNIENTLVENLAQTAKQSGVSNKALERIAQTQSKTISKEIAKVEANAEIERKKAEFAYQQAVQNEENSAKVAEIQAKYEAEKQRIETQHQQEIQQAVSTLVQNIAQNATAAVLETAETQKKAEVEDDIRKRLRGFSRTIPAFLMAYGDENTTLANFDQIVPDLVFQEVTGITLAQFRTLRDEYRFFDETVFNESVKEFLNKRQALADYFDEKQTEDIFSYIPPQKTNQIFTPRAVVQLMLDKLEEENPEIFQNPELKFADLYVKSGLFLTEITKRLFKGLAGKMPNEKDRLQHILENQVYGFAPSEIIFNIAKNFMFNGKTAEICSKNLACLDTTPFAMGTSGENFSEKCKELFGENTMKFDVVVGNPPYQENNDGNNRDNPIYHHFYDLAENISNKYCLISPARFLFGAGQTPKQWNEKMLQNKHIKVVHFNQKSAKLFPNTDIKGGVAILYHDKSKDIGAIDTFTAFEELNSIMNKVCNSDDFISINEILYVRSSYKFTELLLEDYPVLKGRVKKNEEKSMGSNVFDRYPEIFNDTQSSESQIQIYGRQNNDRVYKFIDKKYVQAPENLNKWKVFIPKSNGSGAIGEILSTPMIGTPMIGHTQTFISIGNFDNEFSANALLKYIKSKFARTMLGIKKITQDNATKEIWSKVPLQDFTANSDIDWTKSIAEIDQQLYKKYGLDEKEIAFIEEKVKEME